MKPLPKAFPKLLVLLPKCIRKSKIRFLRLGGTPTINSTVLVPFEGTNISIPQNGIWFKPKSNGTTGISFMITNKSNNSAMSIYQFTRNPTVRLTVGQNIVLFSRSPANIHSKITTFCILLLKLTAIMSILSGYPKTPLTPMQVSFT